MFTRKLLKYVPLILPLAATLNQETTLGSENQYKYKIQEERFKRSSFKRFGIDLNQTINGLEQKSDDLEAMNQNLEGRVNMLSTEKDKLKQAYAHIRAKQSALEKEHVNLKKRAASLEVAYKKLSSKKNVATQPPKPKPVAKKTTTTKVTQKKANTKSNNIAKSTKSKKASTLKKAESSSPLQSNPTKVSGNISIEQKDTIAGGLDIKKINEKGIEYGKKGMYDEAIKEFQRVVAADPKVANAHYNLGLAYKKKGMIAEANKEFAEYERISKQAN